MGLFDVIASAIHNPEQLASSGQLTDIFNSVGQVSKTYASNPEAVQSAMSVVGKHVRSSLQEKRNTGNFSQAQSLVNQFSGNQPSTQAVNMIFSAPQLQRLIQEIEGRTGLSSGTVQNMLPMLVPLVLKFLQTGASKQNPQSSNAVLSSFLDADGDGDVDMMDAMRMASRYLQR